MALKDYLNFFQTVDGAIKVAHERLLSTGTCIGLDGFDEVRVVKTNDEFLVHLIGAWEGSWIVHVPRYRRVTRFECEIEKIDTHLRVLGEK